MKGLCWGWKTCNKADCESRNDGEGVGVEHLQGAGRGPASTCQRCDVERWATKTEGWWGDMTGVSDRPAMHEERGVCSIAFIFHASARPVRAMPNGKKRVLTGCGDIYSNKCSDASPTLFIGQAASYRGPKRAQLDPSD